MAKGFIHEELASVETVNSRTKFLPWTDTKTAFQNINIGVFGSTNSGKTSVVLSIIYELNFPLTILFTDDPNEFADLGAHIPKVLSVDFGKDCTNILKFLCNIPRKK